MAETLTLLGFRANATKGSGDQGVDVIAERDNKTIAIQCKLYNQPIGNKAVQEIIAGKGYYKADYGAVVSNNQDFTKSAIELAQSSNIHLIRFDGIEVRMREVFENK